MAEPGNTPPPPPQETETMKGSLAETAIVDPKPPTSEPAPQEAPPAVVEPVEETITPPPPPQETEPTDGVASALDPPLPTAEPARPPPSQEEPEAAAAGQTQEETTPEAGRQPPMPTKAEEVAALPRPSGTPSQERVVTAVEADKQLPATAAPPLQQPPQQQEGGAAEDASSVHEEEKDATLVRAQEGEKKPARRRWRCLRAAVRLLFLCPKPKDKEGEAKPSAPGGEPPVSGLEDKKTTPAKKIQRKDSAGGVPTEPQPQEKKWDKGEMKPSAPNGKETASGEKEQNPAPALKPHGKDSTGGVLDKTEVKQKDEGKVRHDETQAAPSGETSSLRPAESQAAGAVAGGDASPEGTPAGKTTPLPGFLAKRFQKAAKRLMAILSWYKGHRSPGVGGEAAGAAPMEEGKGDGIKPTTAVDGDKGADTKLAPDVKEPASGLEAEAPPKKLHPKWPREEERLEEILEDAFTRLLAMEYHNLSSMRKKCLLTFSVFELASEVKKQVMVYWWVSEFNLRHRSDQPAKSATPAAPAAETSGSETRCWPRKATAAPGDGNHSPAPQSKAEDGGGGKPDDGDAEGIFSELSSHGFLEPMKNWCSKVIHGCKVNPLVHWMVKRRARDDRIADLDENGNPAISQTNSSILCLTAGNRYMLQKMRMEDESQQAGSKPTTTKTSSSRQSPTTQDKAPDQGPKNTQPHELAEIAQLFKGKKVILNINAHVYPLSKSTFLNLAECLVVLQLGRWCNLDDNTYMEVDGLESLSAISLFKNLRYLSLRGLSRLTELPEGIRGLKKLAILDMRGCQNLVNVKSRITALKHLTHLDLTECYMLEHIERRITNLSELQVFKGFVFSTGTQWQNLCRLKDLKRLTKLQKLTISITTDANVGKGEMAELKHLISLRKLTITWSEIPSILDGESEKVRKRREELVEKWTSFELPLELLKLDIRCYPKKELKLKEHNNLKKLYLRGGDLETFSIGESESSNSSEKTNSIKTLRLRYLKHFNMEWEKIHLVVLKDIEYLEIVPKDEIQKDIKAELYSILDENGVWVKDNKEVRLIALATKEPPSTNNKEVKMEEEAHGAMEKSKGLSGPIEDHGTKATSVVTDVNEDGNDNAIKEQPGLPFCKDQVI
ncbi:hypothetical protein BAE44_0012413 [Dichanthelium oligosanthes]|uniref:Disease resistance R13L4/SHOC-2-like LRR domain-containing protein n=1 Tax=Dichanthelium oligosanthes TaxID=888268 RepID=A0A1E5VN71_9POAL|nr:hypothetical protein BAE44_0012413 [Dichanthelium oligosanthes]